MWPQWGDGFLQRGNTPQKGGLAQLGEHLLCKQGVDGSIPSSSTKNKAVIQASFDGSGFDNSFYCFGCWIFKNSEEVRLCHPGRGGTWVVIVSSRLPSFEPARGSEKVILWLLPVEEDFGEPEFNVIGSSD